MKHAETAPPQGVGGAVVAMEARFGGPLGRQSRRRWISAPNAASDYLGKQGRRRGRRFRCAAEGFMSLGQIDVRLLTSVQVGEMARFSRRGLSLLAVSMK